MVVYRFELHQSCIVSILTSPSRRFDRGGLMRVTSFSINGPTGWKYFARVAYSLAYGTLDLVGYDTSCHTAPHFPPRYMALQAQPASGRSRQSPFPREYKIEMLLHVADNMFGRGSVVRRIRHISTHIAYIAKDTWHNVSRNLTEGQILRIISGIDNVPTIHEEYVVGEDRYSSTAAARLGPLTTAQVATALQNGEFQDRMHLRLLMKDASIKLITQFKTRAGLAQALLDCIKGMRKSSLLSLLIRFLKRTETRINGLACCTAIYISATCISRPTAQMVLLDGR